MRSLAVELLSPQLQCLGRRSLTQAFQLLGDVPMQPFVPSVFLSCGWPGRPGSKSIPSVTDCAGRRFATTSNQALSGAIYHSLETAKWYSDYDSADPARRRVADG